MKRERPLMAGGGVGWLVGWLVGSLVGWLVGWSVGRSLGRTLGLGPRQLLLVRPPPPFTLSRAKGSFGTLGILGDGGGRRAFRYRLSQVVVEPAVPRRYPAASQKRIS